MFNFYLGHIKELTYNSEDSLQNLIADNMKEGRGLCGAGKIRGQ
jgi:hypothetical protein